MRLRANAVETRRKASLFANGSKPGKALSGRHVAFQRRGARCKRAPVYDAASNLRQQRVAHSPRRSVRCINARKRGAFARAQLAEDIRIPTGDEICAVKRLRARDQTRSARIAELLRVDAVFGDAGIGGDVGQSLGPRTRGSSPRGVHTR